MHFSWCPACKATLDDCKTVKKWNDFLEWHTKREHNGAAEERHGKCYPREFEEGEERSIPERMSSAQAKSWGDKAWGKLKPPSKGQKQPDGVPRNNGEDLESWNWKRIYKSLFPGTTTYPDPYESYFVPRFRAGHSSIPPIPSDPSPSADPPSHYGRQLEREGPEPPPRWSQELQRNPQTGQEFGPQQAVPASADPHTGHGLQQGLGAVGGREAEVGTRPWMDGHAEYETDHEMCADPMSLDRDTAQYERDRKRRAMVTFNAPEDGPRKMGTSWITGPTVIGTDEEGEMGEDSNQTTDLLYLLAVGDWAYHP